MKTYVITGATSGIGKALLEELSVNALVFAGYRNPKYEKVLSEMPNVTPFFIDMEKPYTITGAADFICKSTDKIDTLINAAGCVAAGPLEHMEISKIRRQFDVNTFSHLDLTQKLLPLLDGGKVINISSMASFGIFPFVAPYCASKRALDILFNSLEVEMQGRIKVVSVKPGVIATPLWGKSVEINRDCIENDKEYTREMEFLAANALKNEKKGLPVKKVVELIIRVDKMQNPKSSYTIGKDAFCAKLVSKLSFTGINKLMKFGLKQKIQGGTKS